MKIAPDDKDMRDFGCLAMFAVVIVFGLGIAIGWAAS